MSEARWSFLTLEVMVAEKRYVLRSLGAYQEGPGMVEGRMCVYVRVVVGLVRHVFAYESMIGAQG